MKIRIKNLLAGLALAVLIQGCAAHRPQLKRNELSFQHYIAAQTHVEQEDFKAAIREFKKAESYAPDEASIQYALSRAYFRLGQLGKGQYHLKKALKLDPENTDYLLLAGEYYLHTDNFTEATAMCKRVLELDPDNSEAYFGLAMTAAYSSDYLKSVAYLKKLISKEPDQVSHYLMLGKMLMVAQKADEAAAAFKTAVELEPNRPEILYQLAIAYRIQGEIDQATTALKKVIIASPTFAHAYEMLAQIYIDQRYFVEASSYYEKALKLNPDSPHIKNNLAWSYLEAGQNLDQAIQLAAESVELMPIAAHLDTLGWGYFLKEDYPQAEKYLEQALIQAKKDANNETLSVICLHQALFWKKNGNQTRSHELLQEAVKLDPNNLEAQEQLKSWESNQPKP